MSLAERLEAHESRLLNCVHCGFCLPACPTYERLGDEADSPRGRLHLMRAVVEGRLDPGSDAFQTHIDRCLGCRACEPVCPSGVEYGNLLELARREAVAARPPGRFTRALLALLERPRLLAFALLGSRLLRATRLPAAGVRVLPARGRLGRLRLPLGMLAASGGSDRLRVGGRAAPAPGAGSGGRGAAGGRSAPPATSADVAPESASPASAGPSTAGPSTARPSAAGSSAPGSSTPGSSTAGSSEAGSSTAGSSPAGSSPASGRAPAAGRGSTFPRAVALLTGCVQDGLFRRVNEATARVLRANGFFVYGVPAQACCGALHAHAGALEGARRLARANIEAFERSDVDVVAVNAAGCGAAMKAYGHLLEGDPEFEDRARALSRRVNDVSELLAEASREGDGAGAPGMRNGSGAGTGRGLRAGAPLSIRVAYDAPCHLLHAQRVEDAPLRVLRAIPGLELVPLERADECCGGAGIYGITHPELGGRIGRDKVEAILRSGADAVATGNPGCIMQIGAGLRMAGAAVDVFHPVELLDESYRRGGLYAGDASAGHARGDGTT